MQVHTWNLHTPFGGVGIYVTGSSNRFTDNYLDCNALYLEGVVDTDVQNTFLLSWVRVTRDPFNFTPMGDNSSSPAHLHVRPMGRTCR